MKGLLWYAVIFTLLTAGVLLWEWSSRKKKEKSTKGWRVGAVLLIVALIFEVFVANFQSFHLIFGDYDAKELDLTAENVSLSGGTEVTSGYLSGDQGQKMTVEIKDLGQTVGTLRLELSLPEICMDEEGKVTSAIGTPYVDVLIDAKDVTQAASYRSSVANGQVVRGSERTAYITLDLTGEVSDLRIRMNAQKDQYFTLEGVTINEPVPMQFSVIRLLFIVGLGMMLWALVRLPALLSAYGDKKTTLRTSVFLLTVVFVGVALCMTFLYNYERAGTVFAGDNGNQITKELVDAFEAGQVHLLTTPSEELLAMENPYDWSARRAEGVSYLWDHLLFEGKYYSYYGIAPVILLFLPYHLLTGEYFITSVAVFIFGALGIVFLSLLYLEFCERFCKKLPNNILLCTFVILQLSSGVWYNFMSPLFYEIAQSSAFMFTVAGFFFLLRSGILGEGKIKYRHIVLGTMMLSWAVLCRATTAVYCIAALVMLFWGFMKHRRTLGEALSDTKNVKKKRRTELTKYLVSTFICFVLIGGIQVVYNWVRFGNPLDFGIQYSLTINDFTRSQYHTDFVMIGIYNFLFAFPLIKPEFPYVFSNFSTLDVNGYYFVANRNAVGLFIRALPSLGLFGGWAAFKKLDKRERWQAVTILLAVCIAAPAAVIFSIWESGYGVRYCCDFAWQMILGGAAVLFFLYVKSAEGQTKRIMQYAFVFAAVVALFVNGGMLYDYMNKDGYLTAQFLSFERIFDFWT